MIPTGFLLRSLLRAAAGLALATLLVFPVLAQSSDDEAAPRGQRDWAQRFMTLVDTQHKGYITPADAQRYAGERFDRLDRDHHGYIDEAEFVAPVRGLLDRVGEKQKPRLQQALERREAVFKTLDPGGTGKVTRDAYLAAAAAQYAALDTEKNGKVTVDELRTAHRAF